MMSLRALGNLSSGGGAAKLAATYYEEHSSDYYVTDLDSQGAWMGQGAQQLGLEGRVDRQEFQLGLAGYVAGRQVQNAGKENRQMGWDLTFSAPKSVSIAWAGASAEHKVEILEAHHKAADSAFNYLEEHTTTRRGQGGNVHEEAHLVASRFDHHTSRAGDPQLHSHIVVANFSVRSDGTVGTIDSRKFYDLKMAAGALYQVEFAWQMRKLGYEVEPGPKGTFRLVKVSIEAEKLFSKRDKEIDRVSKERGIQSYKATRGVVLSTRPNKEASSLSEREQAWANEAKKAGVDLKVERQSREIVSEKSDHEILREASVKLTTQESTFEGKELLREVAIASMGQRSGEEVELLMGSAEKRGHIVSLDQGVLTTPDMANIERGIMTRIERMVVKTHYGVDSSKAIMQGAGTGQNRYEFTNEQKIAIQTATGASGIAVIQGRAGVGKSTMLQAVRQSYEDQGWKVQGIAVSGQAAQNLQNESGISSSTIASWMHNKNLDSRTVVVLDEAGMVGSKQMAEVFEKVDNAGAKLVLPGDERQLQPINAGGILHAIDQKITKIAPEFSASVECIKRQRDDWMKDVVKEAAQGRTGEALEALHQHRKINIYQNATEARTALADDYIEKNKEDFSKGMILTSRKYDAQKINEEIRGKLQDKGLVKKEGVEFENDQRKVNLAEGDRVLFTRNDYNIDVRNGQRGRVDSVDATERVVEIKLDNGENKKISVDQYNHLDHGWACTTHKAQGATVDRAQVFGYSDESMATQQATYVQISRAREETKLYIVAGERGVEREIKSSEMNQKQKKEVLEEMKKNWSHDGAKGTTLDYIEQNKAQNIEYGMSA